MNKRIFTIAILIFIFAFAAACTVPEIQNTPAPPQSITPTPTAEPIVSAESETTPAPTEEILKAPNEDYSDIVVLRQTMGEYNDFVHLITQMNEIGLPFYKTQSGGKKGIIANNDVIILKVNAQWNERGGTNTDLVDSVIQAILNHPDGFTGEIIIADNGQAQYGSFRKGGSLDWKQNNAIDISQSMQDIADRYSNEYKVSTYLWDTITTTKVKEYSEGDMQDGFIVYDYKDETTGFIVSYPKFTTQFETKISFKHGIFDEQTNTYSKENFKVINMPILKSHGGYGITASVKNYMGVPSDKLTKKNAHNQIAEGGMGTLMAETTVPSLTILDAIWINPIRGPRTEYYKAVNTQIVAVSTDPFALDFWAANSVLIPLAEEAGNTNLNKMYTDESDEPRAFGRWMRLSLAELTKHGHIMRFSSEDVRIFETDD